MNSSFIKDLSDYHKKFDQDHDRLRSGLMGALPDSTFGPDRSATIDRKVFSGSSRFSYALRTAAALAAVFAIVITVMMAVGPNGSDSDQAWARALENAGRVQVACHH